jgi:hypothetical protein
MKDRKCLNYGAWWLQEDWTFEFHQPVLKKITWAERKVAKIHENLDF